MCSKSSSSESLDAPDQWIKLNVGGRVFLTTRMTLQKDPESMLPALIDSTSSGMTSRRDSDGAYLIDRDPRYFAPMLNFLRHGRLILDEGVSIDGVLEEARFFQVTAALREARRIREAKTRPPDLTRQQFIRHRQKMSSFRGLRLMGLDFSCLDLQGLKLDFVDVSHSSFVGADMHNIRMANVKAVECRFSNANLRESALMGSNFARSDFSNCVVAYANFRQSSLRNSSFAGANCSGALFQKADLRGVSFCGATLKHTKFHQACLRGAEFGESSAEFFDTVHASGADLRGAKGIPWAVIAAGLKPTSFTSGAKVTVEEYEAIPLDHTAKESLHLDVLSLAGEGDGLFGDDLDETDMLSTWDESEDDYTS